jgi:hypothetical protein
MAVTTSPVLAFLQRRGLLLALLLFFGACSLKYADKVLDTSERDNRSAFLRWREQILELHQGVNIWEKYNYPNPPIMVLFLEPLVPLPGYIGSMVLYYVKVAMALATMGMVFWLVQAPGRPYPMWAKVLAVLLSLRPIEGDLSHGNINLFVLLLCVGGLACFRLRRDYAAGTCLGLAIACKVTPALFLPYFLWKRSWKVLAGCGAGLVLFFWVVPGLCYSFESNQAYLTSWFRGMIIPYAVEGSVTTEHQNQSLPGLLHRLLTDSPAFGHYENDRYVPDEYDNLVALDPAVVRLLVKLCMLAFVILAIRVCRTPALDQRNRWQLAAEYSLVLVGMLLFSERTWKHHCVTMLLPFSVLAYYLADQQAPARLRKFVLAALIVVALLMTTTGTGGGHWLVRTGKLAQVYGAYVWANLVLTAALAVVLWGQNRPARQSLPAPDQRGACKVQALPPPDLPAAGQRAA